MDGVLNVDFRLNVLNNCIALCSTVVIAWVAEGGYDVAPRLFICLWYLAYVASQARDLENESSGDVEVQTIRSPCFAMS
jgi:hypothetical protein